MPLKNRVFTLLMLLLPAIASFGQNRSTPTGLPVGNWTKKHGFLRTSGRYQVIPIQYYDTIRALGDNTFEVKYKGSTPLMFFHARHNDSIAVKDGIWETRRRFGRLISADYWEKGINVWSKSYDRDGNLLEYEYDDLEKDTNFYLSYRQNLLFKKAYYPPEEKNEQTVLYYPENDLIIADAEPAFRTRFGSSTPCVVPLVLSCKKEQTILSIGSSSAEIQPDLSATTLPLPLKPGAPVSIPLHFIPSALSDQPNAVITIRTDEPGVPPYLVYCSLTAVHINSGNVETLSQLTLSKTKDRYLVIAPLGTVTTAYLTGANGKSKHYDIKRLTRIDLKKRKAGTYGLFIASCETGGNIELTITE